MKHCVFCLLLIILWIGSDTAVGYSGGSGTKADPYQISMASDWQLLSSDSNNLDKYFLLTSDIDMNSIAICPVGDSNDSFAGVLDGNGHTIYNLNIVASNAVEGLGLFGRIGSQGQVLNLGLENISVNSLGDISSSKVGGICGINLGTIENSWVTGSVGGVGDSYVGGICGENIGGVISNCGVSGTIQGSYGIGGLVGFSHGQSLGGGLVGYLGRLQNNFMTGSVVGASDKIGGLVGINNSNIFSCYAECSVQGNDQVGGLIGCHDISSVHDCYAVGSVSGNKCVGGLIGLSGLDFAPQIYNCYASGLVVGKIDTGGLVGQNVHGYIARSFWDTQTTGQLISAGGVGKTTDQMQTMSTFIDVGWDFEKPTWYFGGQAYPRLAKSADVNNDHQVDMKDFSSLSQYWNKSSLRQNGPNDLTGDRKLDIDDLVLLSDKWLWKDKIVIDEVICGDAYTAGTFVPAAGVFADVAIDNNNFVVSPGASCALKPYQYTNTLTMYARNTMAIPKDLSVVTDIFCRFYIHEGVSDTATDWRGINYIFLVLRDKTYNTTDKKMTYKLYWPNRAVPRISTYTPAGVIEASDKFILTITVWNGPKVVLTATAGGTSPADVVASLKAAWDSDSNPLKSAVTATGTDTLILTANVTTGEFEVVPSTREANDAVSDGQTFTVASTGYRNFDFAPGWYECVINKSDYYEASSNPADFDWSQVKRYELAINRKAYGAVTRDVDMTPRITFDLLQFVQTTEKAKLFWRFDNPNQTCVQMMRILEQYGQRGTACVTTSEPGTGSYATVSQLQQLQQAGHLIVNHNTAYHDAHVSCLTYWSDIATLVVQYNKAVSWMYNNGFNDGARIFMLPGGKWSQTWESAMWPITDAVWGIGTKWAGTYNTVFSQLDKKYFGSTPCDGVGVTVETMKTLIDKAILSHGLISFHFHGQTQDVTKIQAVADYARQKVEAGLLEVITPYEFIR